MKRKIPDMKKVWFYAPLLFCLPVVAHAQAAVDFGVGFGSAWDSSSGQGIEGPLSINAFGSCSPSAPVDQFCEKTPSLNGFFLGFSGDIMFKEKFGAGFEGNFQPSRENYGPLQSRVSFIDVNAIYQPYVSKRATIQLQGGIGDARTSFAFSQSSCVGTVVCTTGTQPVGNATHFQVHVGVGVQIGITDHLFIRPQFDLHYAPSFDNQWGNNAVPEATVWVGYHFGSR